MNELTIIVLNLITGLRIFFTSSLLAPGTIPPDPVWNFRRYFSSCFCKVKERVIKVWMDLS